MGLGQAVLIAYALLMLAGGIVGYRIAGSTASLGAGAGAALLLLAAWAVSRTQPLAGLSAGAAVAAVLVALFAYRVLQTKKLMPSGGLLLLSFLALVLLVWAAARSARG
jgi:uncharacterized membrane protein (UPF0136 family)